MITEEQKQELLKFKLNPVLFFEKVLGISTLEPYQKRTLMTVAENDYTVIKACHDVGKSFMGAGIVCWYMTCFPYSKAVTTAPTWNQVKNILWAQIRSMHSKSKMALGGRLNLADWHLTPNGDWFALGFSPRNELSSGEGQGTQSSFQGFHAESGDILILFDEATGIRPGVWDMAEGMMTSGNAKFVGIANPTSRTGKFFQCFNLPTYAKVSLSCFDSPNLIASNITNKAELIAELDYCRTLNDVDLQARLKGYAKPNAPLLATKWVIKNVLDWGIDHPLTLSKVLGEFPRAGSRDLIPLDVVEEAQRAVYEPQKHERRTIGVDVARFGKDSSVITARHGKKHVDKRALQKRDTGEVVGETYAMYREYGADVIVVDGTGLGGGVVDGLRELQRDGKIAATVEIREVQFGAAVKCDGPTDREGTNVCKHVACSKAKWANIKARMFDLLGKDLANGATLPNEDVYKVELPAIRYAFDSKGRMVIESKEEFQKRTGLKSPDHADSLALANFGNYDETTIGTFESKEAFDEEQWPKPLAASLTSGSEW